jgi:hypothetical protein
VLGSSQLVYQVKVSREYGVPEGTLWIVERWDFVHSVDETDSLAIKRARTVQNNKIDKAVFTWFVQEKQSGVVKK